MPDGVFLKVENDVGVIEFDLPDSKVNLLTAEVIQRFDSILDEVQKNTRLKAVVLKSAKRDVFIAGADIKEIEGIVEIKDGEEKSRAGQKILNKLEDLSIPTVAVIDGVALGGGCELILACSYRVATFNEKVKIGLPEVNLGFVPGFGGTYRLPRVVGLTQAIKLITGARPISSEQALRIGLVDRLFPGAGLEVQVNKFIEKVLDDNKKPRPKKQKGMAAFLDQTFIGQSILFSQSRKTILKLSKGFYPAPLKALEVLKRTRHLKREQCLEIEAQEFSKLAVTDISKNLVKLFYLSEKYKKLTPSETEGINPEKIEKCGVIGAGIMGGGIAQILAYKDIEVRLKDINYDAIAQGFKTASHIFQQAVKKRRLKKAEANTRMAGITGTLDYSGFKRVDVVIEAVVEDMKIKKMVFKELSENVSPDAVLCTNTSALSVTEMAKETKDPSRVVGLHFFNPVHRMPLIEIIKTDLTSPETIATAMALTKRLGKTPILVKDSSGFLVNRILLAYLNEAGRILEEGQRIDDVDSLVTRFGMPMGPFTLSDEVGSDVGVKVLKILENSFGDRFKPVDIFEKVYQKGLLGRKSGKGFYIHKRKRVVNAAVYRLRASRSAPSCSQEAYLNRMIYIMINEAARCLEEGVVDEPGAVDIAMVMGTGFPPFRAGLLRYADHVGVEKIVTDLQQFSSQFSTDRFKPCQYLVDLKNKNKGFYS